MFADHGHRIAIAVTDARGAPGAVPDDVGHALLVVLVAVLGLISLLIVLALLEPGKSPQDDAFGRQAPTPPEQGRRDPGTAPQRV